MAPARILVVLALVSSVSSYPYQVNVTDITATSAVLHWKTTELAIEEFLIQCIGSQFYAVARDGRIHNTEMHVRSQFIPKGIDSVRLGDLRPNYNYSCVIQETLPEGARDYNGIISKPTNFTTDYAEPVRPKPPVIVKEDGMIRVNLFRSPSNKFGPISGYKVQFHVIEDSFLGDIAAIDREFTNPAGKFSPVTVEYAQASPKALSFQITYVGSELPSYVQINSDLLSGALKNGVLYKVITVAYTKRKDGTLAFSPSPPSDSFIAVGVDKFVNQNQLLSDMRALQIKIGIIAGILLPLICLAYMCCIGALLLFREKNLAKRHAHKHGHEHVHGHGHGHGHHKNCFRRLLSKLKNNIIMSWITCLTFCFYPNPCQKCCGKCCSKDGDSTPSDYKYQQFQPVGENVYANVEDGNIPGGGTPQDYGSIPYPQPTQPSYGHTPANTYKPSKTIPRYAESSSSGQSMYSKVPSLTAKRPRRFKSSQTFPSFGGTAYGMSDAARKMPPFRASPSGHIRVSPSVSFHPSVRGGSVSLTQSEVYARGYLRNIPAPGVSPNASFHTAKGSVRAQISLPEVPRNASAASLPLRQLSPLRSYPRVPHNASYASMPSSGQPVAPQMEQIYRQQSIVSMSASEAQVAAPGVMSPRHRQSIYGLPPNVSATSVPRVMSPPRYHPHAPGIAPTASIHQVATPPAHQYPREIVQRNVSIPRLTPSASNVSAAMSPLDRHQSASGIPSEMPDMVLTPRHSPTDHRSLHPAASDPYASPRSRRSVVDPGPAPSASGAYMSPKRPRSIQREQSVEVFHEASETLVSYKSSKRGDRRLPANASDPYMTPAQSRAASRRQSSVPVSPNMSYLEVSKPKSRGRRRGEVSPSGSYKTVTSHHRSQTEPGVSPNTSITSISRSIRSSKAHTIASPVASVSNRPRRNRMDNIMEHMRSRRAVGSDEDSMYNKVPSFASSRRQFRKTRPKSKVPSLAPSSKREGTPSSDEDATPPRSVASRKITMPSAHSRGASSMFQQQQQQQQMDYNFSAYKSPGQSRRQSIAEQSIKSSRRSVAGGNIAPPPESPRHSTAIPQGMYGQPAVSQQPVTSHHETTAHQEAMRQTSSQERYGQYTAALNTVQQSTSRERYAQYTSQAPAPSMLDTTALKAATGTPRPSTSAFNNVQPLATPVHSAYRSTGGDVQPLATPVHSAYRSTGGDGSGGMYTQSASQYVRRPSELSSRHPHQRSYQASQFSRQDSRSAIRSMESSTQLGTMQQSRHTVAQSTQGTVPSGTRRSSRGGESSRYSAWTEGQTSAARSPEGSHYSVRSPRGSVRGSTARSPDGSVLRSALKSPRQSIHNSSVRSPRGSVKAYNTPGGSVASQRRQTPHGSHHSAATPSTTHQLHAIPWTTINPASSHDESFRHSTQGHRSPQFRRPTGAQALPYTTTAFHTPEEFEQRHSQSETRTRDGYEVISLSSSQVGDSEHHSAIEVLH